MGEKKIILPVIIIPKMIYITMTIIMITRLKNQAILLPIAVIADWPLDGMSGIELQRKGNINFLEITVKKDIMIKITRTNKNTIAEVVTIIWRKNPRKENIETSITINLRIPALTK